LSNWTSKKQKAVTLSSTEAENYTLSECSQESIFTQSLLKELTIIRQTAIIYEDNLGAIFLTKNQQVSQRTKHIDIRQPFFERISSKEITRSKVHQVRKQHIRSNNQEHTRKST
jgi:hypothetical protein